MLDFVELSTPRVLKSSSLMKMNLWHDLRNGEKSPEGKERTENGGLEGRGQPESNTSESDMSTHEPESLGETATSGHDRRKQKVLVSSEKLHIKKLRTPEDSEISEVISNFYSASSAYRDEYTVYGELVAHKLRKLDDRSRVIAQHNISNVLFEAEMGKYTSFSLQQPHYGNATGSDDTVS